NRKPASHHGRSLRQLARAGQSAVQGSRRSSASAGYPSELIEEIPDELILPAAAAAVRRVRGMPTVEGAELDGIVIHAAHDVGADVIATGLLRRRPAAAVGI